MTESLFEGAFTSEEFNALSLIDAYLGVTRSVFEKAVGILSQGLHVRFYPKPHYFVISCVGPNLFA